MPFVINGLGGSQHVQEIRGCAPARNSRVRYSSAHGVLLGIVTHKPKRLLTQATDSGGELTSQPSHDCQSELEQSAHAAAGTPPAPADAATASLADVARDLRQAASAEQPQNSVKSAHSSKTPCAALPRVDFCFYSLENGGSLVDHFAVFG